MNSSRRKPALIAFLFTGGFFCGQIMAEPVVRYGAFFGNIGSSAAIIVNGVPFEIGGKGEHQTNSEQLNRFLKQGENRIHAVFADQEVAPEPEEENPAPHQFRILIETFTPGEEEEEEFLRVDRTFGFSVETPGAGLESTEVTAPGLWQTELRTKIPPQERSVVLVNRAQRTATGSTVEGAAASETVITFDLPEFPITELPWQQPYTAPTAVEIAAMKTLIIELKDAFATKNAAQITTLLAPKLERIADSMGLPLQEISDNLINSYQETIFGIDNLVFAPVNPDDLVFSQVGNLNLLEAKLGTANPIRGENNEFLFQMRLLFSRVNGAWTLIE